MKNATHLEVDFMLSLFKEYFSHVITIYLHPLLPFLPLGISLLSIVLFILLLRKISLLRFYFTNPSVLLELTPPSSADQSAYATQQLFSIVHNISSQRTLKDRLLGRNDLISFELVSTREQGIKYIIKTPRTSADTLERMIISYLPHVRIKETNDYLTESISNAKILEFSLSKHFALPLAKQQTLSLHDPVAYLTGMMTKLATSELIAFQLVLSPVRSSEARALSYKILHNDDILTKLRSASSGPLVTFFSWIFGTFFHILYTILSQITWGITELMHGSSPPSVSQRTDVRPKILTKFEQEVVSLVQEKVSQPLFTASIRALILVEKKPDQKERMQGITSALAPFSVPGYQALKARFSLMPRIANILRLFVFRKRLISLVSSHSTMLLSVSEISDLYHFPYTQTTKTENIVKAYSKQLPAPLSLKNNREMQVVFGENSYNGSTTPIGLTKEERETHMYVIGRTGSGKTTMLFSMARNDIASGQGMAFIDPHGDVSEDLLASIPVERMNDLVYLNPIDLKYPIGINLLELTPGLDEDDAELEKEVVCEGVISLFRKVFSNEEATNAHRIEYILRNTIYTAFTMEAPTLFTIYDLLNNPPLQKQVTKNLTDENLKNFWKFEFGKAGDFQQVKMAAGVTAKIGRFLFSPTAKRILEQKKSTINFDELMNTGKILICNFSQGNLGEDTARLLGTTIITKIQQAALKRANLTKDNRRPFYLYVDEFQNFATHSFIKMLSEGRKYGLSVTIAEQSTSQQQEQRLVHTILANVTTVVCFRSANPVDEQLMLAQFSPYVEKGDISNLPRYTFYMKVSALESEEPFSGQTIYLPVEKDVQRMNELIAASRKNNSIVYKKPSSLVEKATEKPASPKEKKQPTKLIKDVQQEVPVTSFPELRK